MHYVFYRRSVSRQAGNIQKMLMLQELQTRILKFDMFSNTPALAKCKGSDFYSYLDLPKLNCWEFISRVICEILFMEGRTMINIEQT